MSHIVREDSHGKYLRFRGQIFRPVFPIDYPLHSNRTNFATGTVVQCSHQVHTPLLVVEVNDMGETWFAHGRYFTPRGSSLPSHVCYKPHGFSWEGGVSK